MNQQERITQEIERINMEREANAAQATRASISRILSINTQIRALQVELKMEKEALAAVTYEPVSAAEIIG